VAKLRFDGRVALVTGGGGSKVSGKYELSDFYEIPNLLQESILMQQAGVGRS
jgi:hypothetical protein